MQKTVKKLDDNVIKALTIVCEKAKKDIEGFVWLTHTASYNRFPGSLMVTCVFDTEQHLQEAQHNEQESQLRALIHQQLFKVGIVLKDARKHVRLDSEERCAHEHLGDWAVRLQKFSV